MSIFLYLLPLREHYFRNLVKFRKSSDGIGDKSLNHIRITRVAVELALRAASQLAVLAIKDE